MTLDSVRKARIVWFSWKRAKMSPVLRLAKNAYGSYLLGLLREPLIR